MLKKFKLFLCFITVILLVTGAAVGQEEVKVVLDGNVLEFDVQPQMIDDRTMVPLRVIFETLGAVVEWDDVNQTATAVKGDLVVKTTIGFRNIMVDGVITAMDVAPVVIDGRTLVPVRFVSEALGCDVEWDENTLTVYISSILDNEGESDEATDIPQTINESNESSAIEEELETEYTCNCMYDGECAEYGYLCDEGPECLCTIHY